MTQFRKLFEVLEREAVEFNLVGGMAATVHGSSRLTQDIDIVYRRNPDNLRRLVAALGQHRPYLRGAPPGLPFQWEESTLLYGLNFPLTTELGDIDFFGEIVGGGRYEDLSPHTVEIRLFGLSIWCIDLPTLIRVKHAAGRPRDLEVIAELEAIAEESDDPAESE